MDKDFESPTLQLKQNLSSTMIDFVKDIYLLGCGKILKISVQIDFKDGQMIGFERKTKI